MAIPACQQLSRMLLPVRSSESPRIIEMNALARILLKNRQIDTQKSRVSALQLEEAPQFLRIVLNEPLGY